MIVIIRKRAGEFAGRVVSRFRSRSLEWEHASIIILLGVIMLVNPGVFEGPSFTAFVGPSWAWGWAFLVGGVARFAALAVNGYMARPTALVRVLSAVSGIVLFAAISLGLLFSWTWPTGLAPYPVLGFFGLFSLYWAIFDVAIPDDHHDT